jgi:hypothetical protein
MKLPIFHSPLLNKNTCHFRDCQKISQQYYKVNSHWYVRHIKQLQQSFVDRAMYFDQGTALFRIFVNHLEASDEDAESTLQLRLINQPTL